MIDESPQKPFPLNSPKTPGLLSLEQGSDGSGGSKNQGKGSFPMKKSQQSCQGFSWKLERGFLEQSCSHPPHPAVLVGRSDGGKVAPVGRAGCQWVPGEFEGCLGAFLKREFGCLAAAGAGVTPINLQVWVKQLREVAVVGCAWDGEWDV